MFTGIVEEIGRVRKIRRAKNLLTFEVDCRKVARDAKKGGSIAVDGVCLTVSGKNNSALSFDLMKETLDTTSLQSLREGSKVNLEGPLKLSDRIDGHFVTGHIDKMTRIANIITKKNYTEFYIAMPKSISKYIVPKGSVCVDGVSLTVGKVNKNFFTVYLIPFTKKVTTLGSKIKGDKVNIEADILAKYILDSKKR